MPDLDFRVESAAPVPFAAVPHAGFPRGGDATPTSARRSTAWRCAARFRSKRRGAATAKRNRSGCSICSANRSAGARRCATCSGPTPPTAVPGFTGSATVELQVPCTFDFNVAATKYFHGIENGEIPLCFLFSGTVFYDGGDGSPQVAPISWSKEARFRLPRADVARHDGDVLSEQRLAVPAPGRFRALVSSTKSGTEFPLGKPRWREFCRRWRRRCKS